MARKQLDELAVGGGATGVSMVPDAGTKKATLPNSKQQGDMKPQTIDADQNGQQDTNTENKILNQLQEVMKDRTTIIISHRVSTIKHADQIIVLDEGRIIENGNHETLLANDGFYRHLFESQLMEDEIKDSKKV